jgi:phosphatidate cytidylyltransferase
MLWKRALIALTLGPLALYLVYLGGWFYFLPITAVFVLAAVEYSHIMEKIGARVSVWLLAPAVIIQFIMAQWPSLALFELLTFLTLLIFMAYALWLYERQISAHATLDWVSMMGGLLLFGWVASYFLRLRGVETYAWQWTIIALLSTWSADSGAYLVGKFMAGKVLGRHQLSPRLSPNKTVEGYVGGIVFGVLFTVSVAYFLLQLAWLPALIIALLASIVSPLGDLGMSLLKREAKVKDSGAIFGEHGGALDRIDSLIWTMAMSYFVVLYLA